MNIHGLTEPTVRSSHCTYDFRVYDGAPWLSQDKTRMSSIKEYYFEKQQEN